MRVRLLAAALATAAALAFVPAADAYIYWIGYDQANSRIGRVGLDGSGLNESLVTGIYYADNMAASESNIFWARAGNGMNVLGGIGRADLDGQGRNDAFVNANTYIGVFAVEVNGTHVYFGRKPDQDNAYIARASLANPADVSTEFIDSGPSDGACDIALDDTYVYWTVRGRSTIGRARLDGSEPNPAWLETGGNNRLCGLAVDGEYVYWTIEQVYTVEAPGVADGTSIGRASKSGDPATANNGFINYAQRSLGLDIEGEFIYWTNHKPFPSLRGYIGRACKNGGGVDPDFIPDVYYPGGLAVNSAGPAAPPDPNCIPPPQHMPKAPLLVIGGSSNRTFAPGRASTPVRGRTSAKGVPRGTVFSFTLDQDASVKVAIQRKKAGRKVKGKCRKPKRKNRRKRKCDLTVATLFRDAHAGANEMPFTGRIRGKALKPGRYNAVFTATSAAGTSAPAKVGFRIVRP